MDLYLEIVRWVLRMRNELPIEDVILNVADRMREADGEEVRMLASEIVSLLREERDYAVALLLLDEMIGRFPDDVRFPISKMALHLYNLEDPEEALRCVDLALDRASRTGFFRREALGHKARILLQLGRGQQLSDVLEEIMSLKIKKPVPDIGRERDFVDRAPPGLIREDVLARYNLFRPKRPGDTTANEPPEFELPDDWE